MTERSIVVRVPGRPPTANARRHWRLIARDNEEWAATARAHAMQALERWEGQTGLRWHPARAATLRVVFGVHTRAVRDLDNLICSIKPELDGIVQAGLLVDDSVRVIREISFSVEFAARDPNDGERRKPYTEFEITEVPE